MVSERQVDHRKGVRPVEDRSAGLQRLADSFLLELFEGRMASWHDVASRRVGVCAVGKFWFLLDRNCSFPLDNLGREFRVGDRLVRTRKGRKVCFCMRPGKETGDRISSPR